MSSKVQCFQYQFSRCTLSCYVLVDVLSSTGKMEIRMVMQGLKLTVMDLGVNSVCYMFVFTLVVFVTLRWFRVGPHTMCVCVFCVCGKPDWGWQ